MHLKVVVDDDSPVALRVTLRPKARPWPSQRGREGSVVGAHARTPGEAVTYVVPIEDKVARVGHEMCGGPFDLDAGRFVVLLTAVDAAGNESPAPGGALEFSGPRQRF